MRWATNEGSVKVISLTSDTSHPYLGTPDVLEQSVNGYQKAIGAARYASDFSLPGMLWAAFLRSPVPHARIVSIDVSSAKRVPEVRAILTGDDIGRVRFGRRLYDWPVLAWDRVLFIGDRVAAVAADTPQAAREAVEQIHVEYEELEPIFDPLYAISDNAPILHPDADGYYFNGNVRPNVSHPNLQSHVVVTKENSNPEDLFQGSSKLFEHTFTAPRQHAGYIEPHATLVWLDGDQVNVITTNKAPFSLREQLALVSGRPVDSINVDAGYIGGDFGGKGLSPDEFVCYFLATATGKPIKAVMTYAEDLEFTNARHTAMIRLRTGISSEGVILGHHADVLFDGGAYAAAKPRPNLSLGGGLSSLTPYYVPNSRIDVRTVYTNSVPGGHVRAPGEVQVLFAAESHIDMIADEIGMDPLEFRKLNALRTPGSSPANDQLRKPRAVEVLDALVMVKEDWEARLADSVRGHGVAISVRHVGGGRAAIELQLLPDGKVTAQTGLPDQGAGAYTVISRVVAEVLPVDQDQVRVVRNSTKSALADPGAGGSRVTHVVGGAAYNAALELKENLVALIAEQLKISTEAVRLEQDRVVVDVEPSTSIPYDTLFEHVLKGRLPVSVVGTYDSSVIGETIENDDFNYCGCMVEVEVDKETGCFKVTDAVVAVTTGTVINPIAHQGQIEGGFIFGLGNAVMEDLLIDHGQVGATNLGDYKLPSTLDVPNLQTVLLYEKSGPGPFSSKMVGEISTAGVAPAIANAIANAVGVRVNTMPITAERVYEGLKRDSQRTTP